jgi:hypothetical protein
MMDFRPASWTHELTYPSEALAVLPSANPAASDSAPRHPPITIKIASTRAEREAAFRLVYQRYLSSGLCAANSFQMRITPHHLLPTTTIFVAIYQGEVIFAVSLIGDGSLGVPMESVFSAEIQSLRARGVRFGEISCLADRRRSLVRFLPLFVRVTHLMYQFATQQGDYEFVIAVHPKHGRFYERFFGFRPLGEVRPYQSVQNNPAAAYSLHSSWLAAARQEQYHQKIFTPDQLQPQPLSPEELSDFGRVAIPLGATELLSGGYELLLEGD